jgi:RimJ/RimL family protein N-acetyltransferase
MEDAAVGGGGRMNAAPYTGKRVRLATIDPEKDSELWSLWNRDSEYQSLLDWGPSKLYSAKETREWIEKERSNAFGFSIHTLDDDRIIGFIDLDGVDWTARNAWMGVGIGERDYWGKGYGSEAVNLLLRFAFEELNLNRVTLNVFEYNERAIKAYEKVGFQHEGRQRQMMNRFGQRWDMIFMGILRSEWEEKNQLLSTYEKERENGTLTANNPPR